MSRTVAPEIIDRHNGWHGLRRSSVRFLQGGMEAVALLLVVLSPWAFGATEPVFELFLYAGVALLLVLWGARMVLEWQLTWQKCPVALGLSALYLVGTWQLVPLSGDLLDRLAPGTARMYDDFLPAQPEVLPFQAETETALQLPGSTISLYPAATRMEVHRLLAVFLLFVVVRNNVASTAALERLSIAAAANGTLLALFALIQFFSSAPNKLYWTIPADTIVFGPFINRNHFSFYVNLCIGLGVGLLLRYRLPSHSTSVSNLDAEAETRTHVTRVERLKGRWLTSLGKVLRAPLSLLQDPPGLWMSCALAVMVTSVVFSLSRGGFLALLGGSMVCLVIKLWHTPRLPRLETGLLILVITLVLGSWFGLDKVKARLGTLWKGDVLQVDRIALWSDVAPIVREFPIWGTGYGTFSSIERMVQSSETDSRWLYVHAHNEYLEALVEGGLVRLLLSLLAIGLVFRLGNRAFIRYQGRRASGLVLGALLAFSTLVIHSFVDFGVHIPAITFLATVLCAHLAALGRRDVLPGAGMAPGTGGDPGEYRLRLWGLAPMAASATAVLLGLVLCAGGWRADQVRRNWVAASKLRDATDPADRERQIGYLQAAAQLAPENARLQFSLGQIYLHLFEEQTDILKVLQQDAPFMNSSQAVLAGAARGPAWARAASLLLAVKGREKFILDRQEQMKQDFLLPGLRHVVQARDLSPTMAMPHLWIAGNREQFKGAGPRSAYLKRAKQLVPADPEFWYLCGAQEILDQQLEEALESWRRCLALSNRYLKSIINNCDRLPAAVIINQVLPDEPDQLLAAAQLLHPHPDARAQRRPYLEKALVLLEKQPPPVKPANLHLKALSHWWLGQPAEAQAAFKQALDRDPQVAWRYEYAEFLYDQGQLYDAQYQLIIILNRQQPGHAQARDLEGRIRRDIINPPEPPPELLLNPPRLEN